MVFGIDEIKTVDKERIASFLDDIHGYDDGTLLLFNTDRWWVE